MGIFSLSGRRGREARLPKLPVYEALGSPDSTKERFSNSDDFSDTDSDASSVYEPYSPRAGGSRHTSDSLSSRDSMLPKGNKSFPMAKRSPPRRHLYRLPNKVIRYLCIGMVTTILVFIFALVRASQLENKRIAEHKIEKKPPPPPVWEGFRFLTRYYGGIRTLVPLSENVPQYPRFEDEQPYNNTKAASSQQAQSRELPTSKAFIDHPRSTVTQSAGHIQECFIDAQNRVRVPPVRYYDGRPDGFPDHVVGSYDILSLPEDICFDRYGKFGPYGFGYSIPSGGLGVGEHGEQEGASAVWQDLPQVEWQSIDWAETQQRCYNANAERYKPFVPRGSPPRGFYISGSKDDSSLKAREVQHEGAETKGTNTTKSTPQTHGDLPRTAFVIRCWDEFNWREEDVMNVRSIITEVALTSGGRYDVHLLVEVKNDAAHPIWADDEIYRARIKESVPEEFQGIATLWTQTQMLSLYQGIYDLYTKGPEHPVHGAYRGLQMALQYFAHNHPEYDYFWQWEMDVRYTGHYFDLVSKLENWAKDQPRKGLWERNGRFYVPSVHGSWEDFKQMSRVQSETPSPAAGPDLGFPGGLKKEPPVSKAEKIVWGPLRPTEEDDWFETDDDPVPPTSAERDRYTWGVGEEADLITLNPIFDPEGTSWGLAEDITGYNRTSGPPPRRAQIITASRLSRKLLTTMHRETAFKKHHAFPEMWPATTALHHGLKAVYVPHPVYVDREWPVEYLARVLNGGRNGASGGSRTSVFGEREHNMRGMSWFYNSGFGANLYKRWLGLKVNNDGGEVFEMTADLSKDDETVPTMRGGEGRMCLPPMLLHPVKDVELPVERGEKEVEVPESDPSA
ncbi:hypothetical protein GE09DRAFT_328647 [Coniochaeta sp. 2T2.1]|nr:hypothetical protein GE09DRAFT_328647 [Coniochaeta sp. 2T2.1]